MTTVSPRSGATVQAKRSLKYSGPVAGTAPRVALTVSGDRLTITAGQTRRLSEKEVDVVTRAIAAELAPWSQKMSRIDEQKLAQDRQNPKVWRAIAGTVINYSHRYGKDISQLVRSNYLSGNVKEDKGFYDKPMKDIPNYGAIRQAVIDAMNGKSGVKGATHFFSDDLSPPYFVKPGSAQRVGNLIFAESR